MPAPAVVSWLSAEEVQRIESSAYWNDEALERAKPWWVESQDDPKLLRYLREESHLERAFAAVLDFAGARGGRPAGLCVDLAAGVCWTSALLAREPSVTRVVAVEISRHRIERIAPHVIGMFGAPADKVERFVGSFYDVKLACGSADCVVLSEAYHHAHDVPKLLSEVRRILRPGGILLVTGEEPVTIGAHARALAREVKRSVRERRLPRFGFRSVFPPDPVLGDHFHRRGDYLAALAAAGFRAEVQDLDYKLFPYSRAKACNFLATKS